MVDPIGPYREFDIGQTKAPLYIVPFDKRGVSVGPATQQKLVEEAKSERFTHIYVFSHGWNNTFAQAAAKYAEFIEGFARFRRYHNLASPDPYQPLLAGIVWPSIDLNFPWERTPKFAGNDLALLGAEEAAALQEIQAAGESLPSENAQTFLQLVQEPQLSANDARELVSLIASLLPPDDEHSIPQTMSEVELLSAWTALATVNLRAPGPDDWGVADEGESGPLIAGDLKLDPRVLVRIFSVHKMKDRAGKVGAAGVGPLLSDLVEASHAQVHLLGHSYGCKLLLAAVCATAPSISIESMLLLQPAINYLCFAENVPKLGVPGAYRPALKRVVQPILSTFSNRDRELHELFHLIVRRGADKGELQLAAVGVVPSLYSALGGWGPGGLREGEGREEELLSFPNRYVLHDTGKLEIYGVRADLGITSHSDVINDLTFWALYNQVMAS